VFRRPRKVGGAHALDGSRVTYSIIRLGMHAGAGVPPTPPHSLGCVCWLSVPPFSPCTFPVPSWVFPSAAGGRGRRRPQRRVVTPTLTSPHSLSAQTRHWSQGWDQARDTAQRNQAPHTRTPHSPGLCSLATDQRCVTTAGTNTNLSHFACTGRTRGPTSASTRRLVYHSVNAPHRAQQLGLYLELGA
jgi:hypothetical protein